MSESVYLVPKRSVVCDNCCDRSIATIRELKDMGWRWFKLGVIVYALCDRCRKQNEALEGSGDE